jgi:hypothetical protein
MQSLEIAQAVYQNLRKPSQQKLAWQTLLRAMSDCQKRLLREAQLSDRGWLETFTTFTPSDLDEEFNADGFSIPTRVEYRTGTTEDDWIPVSIVNHDGFSSVTGEAVSFYGSPTRIAYSLQTSDLVGREYRVWYETSPTALSALTDEVAIADIFTDLLTDETVLYCIPLAIDDSPEWANWIKLQMAVTVDRLAESKKQWKKWLNMSRDNGVIYSDGFQGNQCSAEAAYIGPGGDLRAS